MYKSILTAFTFLIPHFSIFKQAKNRQCKKILIYCKLLYLKINTYWRVVDIMIIFKNGVFMCECIHYVGVEAALALDCGSADDAWVLKSLDSI